MTETAVTWLGCHFCRDAPRCPVSKSFFFDTSGFPFVFYFFRLLTSGHVSSRDLTDRNLRQGVQCKQQDLSIARKTSRLLCRPRWIWKNDKELEICLKNRKNFCLDINSKTHRPSRHVHLAPPSLVPFALFLAFLNHESFECLLCTRPRDLDNPRQPDRRALESQVDNR